MKLKKRKTKKGRWSDVLPKITEVPNIHWDKLTFRQVVYFLFLMADMVAAADEDLKLDEEEHQLWREEIARRDAEIAKLKKELEERSNKCGGKKIAAKR